MTAAAIGLSMQVIAGDCHEQWVAGDGVPGVEHQQFWYAAVRALTMWDPDGDGPASAQLVVAGSFTVAGDVSVNKVARWDGRDWHPMDAGVSGEPRALLTADLDSDGSGPVELFMGVAYSPGDSLVFRWSGSSWAPVGELDGFSASALTSVDLDGDGPQPAALAASGSFFNDEFGFSVIALWTGTRWNVFGEAFCGCKDPFAYSIVSMDWDGEGPQLPQLIVGGEFNVIDGVAAARIARWDGESWHPLGSGVNGQVLALHSWDSDGQGPAGPLLAVGGSFTTAGGIPASRIATWDGSAWNSVGGGTSGPVLALSTFDPDRRGARHQELVASGSFLTAGGVPANSVARWDGLSWQAFGQGCDSIVRALAADQSSTDTTSPTLYVGGTFGSAGDVGARNVAAWQDEQWHQLGSGFNDWVLALSNFSPGEDVQTQWLVAGGSFTRAGSTAARRVAAWNGRSWHALGDGLDIDVNALTAYDLDGVPETPPSLIAGGSTSDPQLLPDVPRVSSWNGRAWLPVGDLNSGSIYAFASHDADGDGPLGMELVAGGHVFVDGVVTGAIRWTGKDWAPIGGGFLSGAFDICSFDPDENGAKEPLLVAGGAFTAIAGDQLLKYLAAWNGRQWISIGTPNERVFALTTYDFDGPGPKSAELVAGGDFTMIAGVQANCVARWDGSQWNPLGLGTNGRVESFVEFDPDGEGPLPRRLIVAGSFNMAGGRSCKRIARTDGQVWEPLADGVSYPAHALAVHDRDGDGPIAPQLAVGGIFLLADNQPSSFVARWGFESTPFHPADSDCSGTIDGVDLAALLGQWSGSATYSPCPPYQPSDLNQDCRINGFDLALLLGAWTS